MLTQLPQPGLLVGGLLLASSWHSAWAFRPAAHPSSFACVAESTNVPSRWPPVAPLTSETASRSLMRGERATPALLAVEEGQPTKRNGSRASSASGRTRRETVRSLASWAAALVVLSRSPARAAVPSIDEYYGGAGAKPRTDSFLNRSRPPAGSSSGEAGSTGSSSSKQEALPPEQASALLSEVAAKLDDLEALVTQERWDDILAALKARPLVWVASPWLGYGSAAQLAKALDSSSSSNGPPVVARAKVVEGARELLGVSLQQLRDFAFSNRVIFFNQADRSQVAMLAAQRQEPPDLSEPRAILSDARAALTDLQHM